MKTGKYVMIHHKDEVFQIYDLQNDPRDSLTNVKYKAITSIHKEYLRNAGKYKDIKFDKKTSNPIGEIHIYLNDVKKSENIIQFSSFDIIDIKYYERETKRTVFLAGVILCGVFIVVLGINSDFKVNWISWN